MKESISLTSIFQIVVLFIVLFTGIMALTINNSTSFGVKDEVISAIDFNGSNFISKDGQTLDDEIVDAMEVNSYRNTGTCETSKGWVGFDRNGEKVVGDHKASLCIRCVKVTEGIEAAYRSVLGANVADNDFINGYYFQVIAFYQLDLPSFNESYSFHTKGDSKTIYSKEMPRICNP